MDESVGFDLAQPAWDGGNAPFVYADAEPKFAERAAPAQDRPQRKSGVRIRLPQETDWPALRELVRRHHERTVFSGKPFSEKKYAALEKEARKPAAHQCLIVAEVRGQAVGMAWFSAGEYVLSEDSLMTTTHLLAVDAERCGGYLSARVFLRLLRGIVVWSQSRKSSQVLVHVTTGVAMEQTDRLLRAGGATCIGGGYRIGTC